jgi:methyl-accepting chemotaxis protein
VIGPLVVSKATGKASAIVAVPVRAQNGAVVGVLGASVDLVKLSGLLKEEMALREGMIFYAFDAEPLVALNGDPTLVFLDPFSLGPEIREAFEEMLSHDQGVVRYTFRDQVRTVVYRRSPVTGWWYAFGRVGPGASGASSRPR